MILLFFLSACSTAVKVTELTPDADVSEGSSGVLIPYGMTSQAIVAEEGCIAELVTGSELKTHDMQLSVGSHIAFVELAPGDYGFKRIYCGSVRFDGKGLPPFRIVVGKISVIRPMTFNVDTNRHMFGTIGALENVKHFPRKQGKDLSVKIKARLISGYTSEALH